MQADDGDKGSGGDGQADDPQRQQERVRAVRDDQYRHAPADGGGDAAGGDKPDVVSGNIELSWRWHDETDALIRAAIESANDAIIITENLLDPPGPRIEYVNPAFTAMTGWSLDEVLGQTPRILQGPKTDRGLLRRLRDDLVNGRVFHGETTNYRKDGTAYVVEWRITAMRGPDGKVLKWVAVQRDVTERRQAEERRERLLADERAAREAAEAAKADAERARAEAERVGRMKDEFLATLSHELRTPLNAILGWSQLLLRGRLGADDARRALDTIERNARTQGQLIEDLLDMSRILSGAFRLEVAPVDLRAIVEAAVESLAPAAAAKRVELRAELDCVDEPACLIRGDAARLQQIAWNLVSNAVKFTPEGGHVAVSLGPVVDVAAGDAPGVELTVSDDGIGVEPEFLPFVFDRFRQADATTTRRHGGLGLGLSIVKQLAELHGGSVRATSDGPGRGATFSVRLPTAGATAASAVPAPAVPPEVDDADGSLAGCRVLLVDDQADARSFVRRVLDDAGATVEEADGAAEALAAAAAGPFDLIVSDIGMPGVDGYDLIRALRGRSRPGVPAIALTAFARAEDRERALAAGYQMHLAKPIDGGRLLEAARSLVVARAANGRGEERGKS